jgi:UDP-glucuronate 4-epimerase
MSVPTSRADRHALVTGGAGFIGSHLVDRLLADGWRVTVVDNFDPFYPRAVKESNMAGHFAHAGHRFIEGDILDNAVLDAAFAEPPSVVVHLAAKAGVRPSIEQPLAYHRVNVTGTLMLLERARMAGVPHFVLASSSSVYGVDPGVPWREDVATPQPISPYAASKLAAEQFAQVHSHLYGMKVTALRFFTVHGPRQRPDLAIHKFFKAILEGKPITRFGDGGTQRDYTFVDDIVQGVVGALHRERGAAFEIYNLGGSDTIALNGLIEGIERVTGRRSIIDQRPEQPGDVPRTYADITKSHRDLGYAPATPLLRGLEAFHAWYIAHAASVPAGH